MAHRIGFACHIDHSLLLEFDLTAKIAKACGARGRQGAFDTPP
ncbi:hypothetical protein HMPREF1155_0809 [Slackia sp. CM382]|nr:hypothetical protein HMPREF1155_0809 [Slackia sp. CM382]